MRSINFDAGTLRYLTFYLGTYIILMKKSVELNIINNKPSADTSTNNSVKEVNLNYGVECSNNPKSITAYVIPLVIE